MSLAVAVAVAALAAGPPAPLEPTAREPVVVDGRGVARGWLRAWADIVQRAGSDLSRPEARRQAAGLLIGWRWVRGEAAERGIGVAPAEVDASYDELRRLAFPRARAYRRYLRETGQTEGNLRVRVEIDLLATRLREQATAGAADEFEAQERLEAFVDVYNAKWQARTACRPPWVNEFSCQPTARRRGDAIPFARTQFLPSAFAR